jgi:hypothetical protein
MRLLPRFAAPCLVACLLLLGACGSLQEPSSPAAAVSKPASAPAPAPRYNLAGYSPAFKQGYADACAAPRRQNAARFKSETDYSMGWQDGQSACRSR